MHHYRAKCSWHDYELAKEKRPSWVWCELERHRIDEDGNYMRRLYPTLGKKPARQGKRQSGNLSGNHLEKKMKQNKYLGILKISNTFNKSSVLCSFHGRFVVLNVKICLEICWRDGHPENCQNKEVFITSDSGCGKTMLEVNVRSN